MFSVIYKKIFLIITAVIFIVSIGIIAVFGVRFGLDFTGGSLLEVHYADAPAKEQIEEAVSTLDYGNISVRVAGQSAGEGVGYMIRTRDLNDSERIALESVVLPLGEEARIDRFTSVGPVIGEELKGKAMWAIAGISLIIVLYVAYAFAGIGIPVSSWAYGAITILVLLHDILVPTALMAILGVLIGAEIDVLFVMAILAVLGYSVNDTIVVFDRVRENLKANRTEEKVTVIEPGGIEREEVTYTLTKPYAEIVGSAVSQSLGRSINTSLTTMAVLASLYILGGSLTQIFALILLAGVLAGTYSSLCIASPLLVAYNDYQERKKAKLNLNKEA
ncbi:MAG: protein translocase subunit SecF [Candidatus Paceibacteria bacterium]